MGTGVQAHLQLELLKPLTECREVTVWGRTKERVETYLEDAKRLGFEARAAADFAELLASCNLTTTPATSPLLHASDVRPGTHITAVGSDTREKQELDATILARADVVVADSLAQCRVRGEIAHALAAGEIPDGKAIELGAVLSGDVAGRTSDEQITVADLTGVAVQDIQIAQAVLDRLRSG